MITNSIVLYYLFSQLKKKNESPNFTKMYLILNKRHAEFAYHKYYELHYFLYRFQYKTVKDFLKF